MVSVLRARMTHKPSLTVRQHTVTSSAQEKDLPTSLGGSGGSIRRRQLQNGADVSAESLSSPSPIPKDFDARHVRPEQSAASTFYRWTFSEDSSLSLSLSLCVCL